MDRLEIPVWRKYSLSIQEAAFSTNGYNGPFNIAWTIDGKLNASFLGARTINGELIKANTISANALSLQAKKSLSAMHTYLNSTDALDITKCEFIGNKDLVTVEDGRIIYDGRSFDKYDYGQHFQWVIPSIKKAGPITFAFTIEYMGLLHITR